MQRRLKSDMMLPPELGRIRQGILINENTGAILMKRFSLLIGFAILTSTISVNAQTANEPTENGQAENGPTLQIGDPAPALQIGQWIQGEPIKLADGKGEKIYVIDFWATWCEPCLETIPHTNEVHKKYREKGVVVIAISDEEPWKVSGFLKSNPIGQKIEYRVACDDNQKTNVAYMLASGQMGIPTSFIVDKQGRVAWIGHPLLMESVLDELIAGTFDLEAAKATAQADANYLQKTRTALLMAMLEGTWDKAAEIGDTLASNDCKISRLLRAQELGTLAWILLTKQEDSQYYPRALTFAEVSNKLCDEQDPYIIDTYALALFKTGKIDQAVTWQKKAVELAPTDEMKKNLQQSLDRYEQAIKEGKTEKKQMNTCLMPVASRQSP